MASTEPVELSEGARVNVELADGSTCVARIDRVAGDTLHLTLLDDLPEGQLAPNGTVEVFVAREAGIYTWPTRVSSGPDANEAVLSLLGPARLLQRRVHPRVEVDLTAELRRVLHGRRSRPVEARIADLSRGGMKLLSPGALEPGDRVEVAVDLGAGHLAVTGRVVMAYPAVDGGRVGHVAFAEELSGALAAIDAYLAGRVGAQSP